MRVEHEAPITEVTQDAMRSFASASDPRLAKVMGLLVKHMHAFVAESKLSKAEWLKGLEFLTNAAKITTDERNEFSLFSDVMGISSMVDVVSQPPGGTPSSVLGPFHNHDSEFRPNGSDLTEGQAGDRVWLHGRVLDLNQQPIAGAQIDFWQNADNGLYPAQDAAQDPQNLRCKIICDDKGGFSLLTIRPHPYTVPTDGPVGPCWQPATAIFGGQPTSTSLSVRLAMWVWSQNFFLQIQNTLTTTQCLACAQGSLLRSSLAMIHPSQSSMV